MRQSVGGASRWGAVEQATRSPEEIFAHHIESLRAEDLEGVMLDYADDACLVTTSGVLRGRDAIRQFFAGVFRLLPRAQWEAKTTFIDDLLFLEWTADSARHSVPDGVDTVIFQDGLIRAQTVRCTLVPKH